MSSYLTLQPKGTGSCLPASPCCWHGKMAPDQTQEKQQAEGQCYCWGLTIASHHQAAFTKGRQGDDLFPTAAEAERAPKPIFFLPKGWQTDLFRNSLSKLSEAHTWCCGWRCENAKLCCISPCRNVFLMGKLQTEPLLIRNWEEWPTMHKLAKSHLVYLLCPALTAQ